MEPSGAAKVSGLQSLPPRLVGSLPNAGVQAPGLHDWGKSLPTEPEISEVKKKKKNAVCDREKKMNGRDSPKVFSDSIAI